MDQKQENKVVEVKQSNYTYDPVRTRQLFEQGIKDQIQSYLAQLKEWIVNTFDNKEAKEEDDVPLRVAKNNLLFLLPQRNITRFTYLISLFKSECKPSHTQPSILTNKEMVDCIADCFFSDKPLPRKVVPPVTAGSAKVCPCHPPPLESGGEVDEAPQPNNEYMWFFGMQKKKKKNKKNKKFLW